MLLEVSQLRTSFQTRFGRFNAVDDVSFSLDHNQILGIVGESGCGKSVTALSILQLLDKKAGRIEGGEILFNSKDLVKCHAQEMRRIRGREISMIFQEPMTSLNPVFKVGDQIQESIMIHAALSKSRALRRVHEIMELVGIPDPRVRADFYPHQLSGGLRQRVMIAMALCTEPKLLIADEPTTALDVSIQAQILELIRDLQKKMGMAVLFITHDFGVVKTLTDRVIVMYAGKIVESGNTTDILERPQHAYTRALQKAIPRTNSKNKRLYNIPFMVPSAKDLIKGLNVNERWRTLEEDLQKPLEDLEPISISKDDVLLRAKDINVVYGQKSQRVEAVKNVSFSIYKNEILGLVGESGCGKSTLGKALLRLVQTQSGEVYFQEQELLGLSRSAFQPQRKKLQMIFQDPYSSLNPRMRIKEILEEPLIVHRLGNKAQRLARIYELLDCVGLPKPSLNKFPHEFSGGQRQRIGIARALAVDPEFIVADEPVSALDVSIQAQILNLLQSLRNEFKFSFLFISHDLNVVHYLCDRIMIMNKGEIVDECAATQLFSGSEEQNEYTKKLLSSVPH